MQHSLPEQDQNHINYALPKAQTEHAPPAALPLLMPGNCKSIHYRITLNHTRTYNHAPTHLQVSAVIISKVSLPGAIRTVALHTLRHTTTRGSLQRPLSVRCRLTAKRPRRCSPGSIH
jgi:hypothetical protein